MKTIKPAVCIYGFLNTFKHELCVAVYFQAWYTVSLFYEIQKLSLTVPLTNLYLRYVGLLNVN